MTAKTRKELEMLQNTYKKSTIGTVIIVVLLVLYIVVQPFYVFVLNGSSMSPTLKNGSLHFARKTTPQRGDIVVFDSPNGWKYEGDRYVKRLVGVPGDLIELNNDGLFVNGKMVYKLTEEDKRWNPNSTFELKEGEAFVLGDNFPHSLDSLTFLIGMYGEKSQSIVPFTILTHVLVK